MTWHRFDGQRREELDREVHCKSLAGEWESGGCILEEEIVGEDNLVVVEEGDSLEDKSVLEVRDREDHCWNT